MKPPVLYDVPFVHICNIYEEKGFIYGIKPDIYGLYMTPSSSEWIAVGEKRPKRPKTQMWAGRVMVSVFWDAHGFLFIDYLENDKTINSERYIGQLMRLKNEIGEKRLQIKKKKVLFHQDNAPCHKSLATMAKLNESSFELLPHPPYSPDLAPATTTCLQTSKKCYNEKDCTPTRKSLPERTLISRPKINRSTRKVLK